MNFLLVLIVSVFSGPFNYEWPDLGDESFNLKSQVVVKKADPKYRHILYFTATWCGPCNEQQKPIIEQMKKAAKPWDIGDKIKRKDDHIWQYDYDVDNAIAIKYNVTLVPTFILVDSEGRELHRVTGVQTSHQLATLYSRKQ